MYDRVGEYYNWELIHSLTGQLVDSKLKPRTINALMKAWLKRIVRAIDSHNEAFVLHGDVLTKQLIGHLQDTERTVDSTISIVQDYVGYFDNMFTEPGMYGLAFSTSQHKHAQL